MEENPTNSIIFKNIFPTLLKLIVFILLENSYRIEPIANSNIALNSPLYINPVHTVGPVMFPYLCDIHPPINITINGAIKYVKFFYTFL